jgi:hypothetical protein
LGGALLSVRRPVFEKGIVRDANSEFDKAIAGIKLWAETTNTEPSSSKEQVELFCLKEHELALEEIGRQMVEQCAEIEARSSRVAQSRDEAMRAFREEMAAGMKSP